MKRTALKTKTPLKAKASLKAKKRLPAVGKRKRAEIDSTGEWRRQYLGYGKPCEICDVFLAALPDAKTTSLASIILGGLDNCRLKATCLHERKKRTAGGSLTDPVNLMRCCGPCNSWVEQHPIVARLLGLTVRAYQDSKDIPLGFHDLTSDSEGATVDV